jgi:CBS domain-containing protein
MADSDGPERPAARTFDRPDRALPARDLVSTSAKDLVTRAPVTTPATATIAEASRLMRDERISSLPVVEDGELVGILTVRDLANRVVAEGRTPEDPVATVMTADPATLPASALVADLLRLMLDRGIGHVPLVEEDRLVGMVTSTDLTRLQALSTDLLTHDIEAARSVEDMVRVTAGLETLLVRLVTSRHPHAEVTRRITDVADAVTRRLIALAEAELGPPPVPYVWAACGSQGRREQTGVTDQDNCLIIDDDMEPQHDEYFARLATIVSDGLAACGYVYCSGEMMATTPQWRQPLRTWREYFDRWIEQPDPKAQMLASVMFDLRPIAGDTSLFTGLQHDTLRRASANQIFVAHMISNSMLHSPPLTFLRGISTQRSGEHRHTIDLKLNGVIPIVDLGRLYALRGRLTPVNTRERLLAAEAAGVISSSGGRDLVAAYDVIATMRLEHQARCITDGDTASNFLNPKDLSDFERGHLREAFLVVKTMQSAIGQGTGMLR